MLHKYTIFHALQDLRTCAPLHTQQISKNQLKIMKNQQLLVKLQILQQLLQLCQISPFFESSAE